MARIIDFQVGREALDTSYALIDGLTVAVCAPTSPMRLDVAHRSLAEHLRRQGVDLRRSPSTYFERLRDVTPPLPHVSSW